MESLTYLCTDVSKLVDLDTELKRSLQAFRAGLPSEKQLIETELEPKLIAYGRYVKLKTQLFKSFNACVQHELNSKHCDESNALEVDVQQSSKYVHTCTCYSMIVIYYASTAVFL